MARYSTGQPIRLFTTTSQIGPTGAYTPTNAGALTLTIRRPDLTTISYATPVNSGTGTYYQDVAIADLNGLTGQFLYKWTATGAAAGESIGNFDVYDPFEPVILSLQDAKSMLNIPQATTTHDTELSNWIATLESSFSNYTGGPILSTAIAAERVEVTRAYTAMALRQRPVVSVQSITSVASGQTIDISDIEIDNVGGIIHRKLGWPFYGPYFTWMPIFYVAYTAGWGTACPPALESAARIIIKYLWESERGETPAPMQAGEEPVTAAGMPWAIPPRALELMAGQYPDVNGQLLPFESQAYV